MLGINNFKKTKVVVTGSHAHTAADAAIMVNENDAVIGVISSPDRADINTRGILTLVTWYREEVSAASWEICFKDLNPFLSFGNKMPHDTRLGTLGRYAKPGTAITLFQVDNHTPGTSILTVGSQRGGDGGGTHPTRCRVNEEGRNQQQPGNSCGAFNKLSPAQAQVFTMQLYSLHSEVIARLD